MLITILYDGLHDTRKNLEKLNMNRGVDVVGDEVSYLSRRDKVRGANVETLASS